MPQAFTAFVLGLCLLLTACGGEQAQPVTAHMQSRSASAPQPEMFTKLRSDYAITASADGYVVADTSGHRWRGAGGARRKRPCAEPVVLKVHRCS